jgi:hypothetical protein
VWQGFGSFALPHESLGEAVVAPGDQFLAVNGFG